MNLQFDSVYYEPSVIDYPLGKQLKEQYAHLPWFEIQSHNRIESLSSAPNSDFAKLKQHLIIGVRKTHKYTENHKVSDWLVPYTSSGCKAMCLYCYLVCNYNKCSYLRLFVNREQMLERLIKKSMEGEIPQVFEIGSNSDLLLENEITDNLTFTIETFAKNGRGQLTFPTKFHMVEPLLDLDHRGKTIFRMSVNPSHIIKTAEIGTSPLDLRISALNRMAQAGYPVGLLIAPVILVDDWKKLYGELIDRLSDELSQKVKDTGFLEIILMTYSFVQNAINTDAFPHASPIFNRELMTGRGRGKYCYRTEVRDQAEAFLKERINDKLKMKILYIS